MPGWTSYVSKLLSGEKYRPLRDVLIRLGAPGLELAVPDLDELLMAAEYLPILVRRRAGPNYGEQHAETKEVSCLAASANRSTHEVGAH